MYSYDSNHYSRRQDSFSRSRESNPRYSRQSDPPSERFEPRYAYSQYREPRTYLNHSEHKARKQQWPPSPFVEEELKSLAREYKPTKHKDDDDVPSRGAVDQESLLDEIERPNDETRFVLVSDGRLEEPPSGITVSEKEKRRRPREHNDNGFSSPTAEFDIPILQRREPSPYSFSKVSTEDIKPSAGDYLLSTDPITPTNATPRSVLTQRDSQRYDPRPSRHTDSRLSRESTYGSAGSTSGNNSEAVEDSDPDLGDVDRLRANRKPARYSFVATDLEKNVSKTSVHDFAEQAGSKKPDITRSDRNRDQKPSTSPSSVTPPLASRIQTTTSVSETSGEETAPSNRFRDLSRHNDNRTLDSRSGSPLPSQNPSPRSSHAKINPLSRAGSYEGSRSSSPLGSPIDPSWYDIPPSNHPSTWPPVDKERAKLAARPPSLLRQESLPTPPLVNVQGPAPIRPEKAPLPYPEDDMNTMMPSEEKYQTAAPNMHVTVNPAPKYQSGPSTPQSPSMRDSLHPRGPATPIRDPETPNLAQHIPLGHKKSSSSGRDAHNDDSKSNSDALILPPCPRPNYETKFDDWFTLEGCPNFDICPSCLDSIITPTEFRKYFKPASKRPLGTEIRCDFGSPWFRFAWLLTIKQKRGDLALLYALATLTETEKPCPGTLEAAGTWYTVTDDYNERVPNFRICSRDMKFLEALFPTLRSRITRTSSRDSRAKRLCSLRVQSSRFPKYIDLMVDIDSTAQRKRRKPDLGPLLNLIKENSYKPECNRDNIMLDQLWHFIPGLPEFTVCEECYEHIVYPHVRAGSSIAAKFNSTPTYAPGEDLPGPNLSSGNSCQLYSHRMRHIFAIAIEDNDIAYLVRKATERKKAELDLQGQHKRLKRLLEGRLGYGYHSGAADPVWIDQEMNRLAKLWKEWE